MLSEFKIQLLACWVLVSALPVVLCQTQCSIKVPVPNLGFCDAVGALEEHVDGDVYETRGRVLGLMDYQLDSFILFDQQFKSIINESSTSEANVKDIEEEIDTLKRSLKTLEILHSEAEDEESISDESVFRVRRAANQLPSVQQQQVDAAQASFAQALASVLLQIQTADRTLAAKVQNDTAYHVRLQQELTANEQDISSLEKKLNTLEAAVKQALAAATKGNGGVSLAAVRQEVTDLVINASVAEQVAQRQLNLLDQTLTRATVDEAAVDSALVGVKADMANLTGTLGTTETEIQNLDAGRKIVVGQVSGQITQMKTDLTQAHTDAANAANNLGTAGDRLFNMTIGLPVYEGNLHNEEQKLKGLESLVTFSKKTQQSQIVEILLQKKNISDDILLMQYAFGVTNKIP
ncbi:uncharacterized protein LOC128225969 [Mya arenaria]|uniref:uncharacterized protein LOC128225969 n=1 Tax=Mya arenaria TaxID=6604 RepID=UPI0022E89A7D|nr:uncharacterized protein LOC128225969 [Mya arenaria]